MKPQTATTFVAENKVLVANPEQRQKSRCVDSRYEEPLAALAKPGGDVGDLLTAFAALNRNHTTADPRQVLELVLDNIGGVAQFHFHTDTEADPNEPGLGCAHIKYARLYPKEYDLTIEQMDFVLTQLPQLLEHGAKQEVLAGSHNEQAVIVVVSEDYTLKPKQTAFVYHKTLDQKRLIDLGTALSTLTGIDMIDSVRTAAEQQLEQTLKRVAFNKKLPVYTAVIDSHGQVSVS